MAKINVQGLGIIEVQGDSPSAEEIKTIQKLIKNFLFKSRRSTIIKN